MNSIKNTVEITPRAIDIMNTTRFMGYTTEAAVADIIDNSISAEATDVYVEYNPVRLSIQIIDNGHGMSFEELKEAMRYGRSLDGKRADYDLGRFGLGLKTASFSQCDVLTVISKKNEEIHGLRWDPYYIEQHNCGWEAIVLEKEDINNYKSLIFDGIETGTMVIWEQLSLMLAGESDKASALSLKMAMVREHIRLVFHRFISGEKGIKKVNILFNGQQLQERDPFLKKKSTLISEDQMIPVDLGNGKSVNVVVRRYQLPSPTRITKDEMKMICGERTLADTQGFYVYRNKRLLVSSTWFRLAPKTNSSRLSRIMVDIPATMDQLWALDIKKSTAKPPEIIRKNLRALIDFSKKQSEKSFHGKSVIEMKPDVVHFWRRIINSENQVVYSINEEHPRIVHFIEKCSPSQKQEFFTIIKYISQMIPTNQMFIDMDEDKTIAVYEEQKLAQTIEEELASLFKESLSPQIVKSLYCVEPFSKYPHLIDKYANNKKGQ